MRRSAYGTVDRLGEPDAGRAESGSLPSRPVTASRAGELA
jgi:hypothetical protein